jgi:uncharacterized phage protein (predicted DNA packaging)
MTDLVTLDEAKEYARVDGNTDDALIAMLIEAASDAVADYADGWNGTGDVPARIKLAVLVRVAAAYDKRETLNEAEGEHTLVLPYRTLDL